jgi:CRISPR-associated endonuclease/helicase Cas3
VPEALATWAEEHRRRLSGELEAVFGPLPTVSPDPGFAPHHSDLWLLAGLITVADWIGSNETWFPSETGMPPDAARRTAGEALHRIGWPGGRIRPTGFSAAFAVKPGETFTPNALQQAVAEAARTPGVIIVEGPMGCGKTEAALFAAEQLIASEQQRGIYFALPTQVTSNRIYLRVERFLRNTLAEPATLRLAHGNAWLEEDFELRINPAFPGGEKDADTPTDNVREARSWFASAKQALLAPYGVGTIDQALQSVVAVKHFFVRRFALAGKVVVLDEVHSYDVYTGALITALIRELVNLRCSVIVLSATLTAGRRRELLAAAGITEASPDENGTDRSAAYPRITFGASGGKSQHLNPHWSDQKRVTVRPAITTEEETISQLIGRADAGQHVLWIRNTVVEAQYAFRAVVGSICQGAVRVGLLHSRFPFARRAELEQDWLEFLGPNRPASGPGSILIATQVVEQSVDIDLDFIVSDLAPTDMLLQRMGRLWRRPRAQRSASAPEFWLRLPEIHPGAAVRALKSCLGRSGRVYAPYVLLRTAAVWRIKSEITLPSEIRPLLEATYAEPDPREPASWQELHAELERDKRTLAANAQAATLVLGRPMLQDEDSILTRRPSAPTVPVALFRSVISTGSGTATVVALDGGRAEISGREWRRASARFAHQWVVRAPKWMVPADAPRPPWFKLHGPDAGIPATVGHDARCCFGGQPSSMMYDACLGLSAERAPSKPSQPNDDDEFDY